MRELQYPERIGQVTRADACQDRSTSCPLEAHPHQRLDGFGHQHLAPMPRGHEASGTVHTGPEQSRSRSSASPAWTPMRTRNGPVLSGHCSAARLRWALTHASYVSRRLSNTAWMPSPVVLTTSATRLDRLSQDGVVARQGVLHLRRVLLPNAGRALQVGKKERQRSGRELSRRRFVPSEHVYGVGSLSSSASRRAKVAMSLLDNSGASASRPRTLLGSRPRRRHRFWRSRWPYAVGCRVERSRRCSRLVLEPR